MTKNTEIFPTLVKFLKTPNFSGITFKKIPTLVKNIFPTVVKNKRVPKIQKNSKKLKLKN